MLMSFRQTRKHTLSTAAVCLLLCSCTSSDKVSTIEFQPFYGGKPIGCDSQFKHGERVWTIDTLSLFVSSLSVHGFDAGETRVKLLESNWQNEQTALLWFVPCINSSKAMVQNMVQNNTYNHGLSLKIDASEVNTANKLTFNIAVPFAENHANPLTQKAPLNNPSMFWAWQTGHKFLRMDIKQISGESSWAFHLGSVGCLSKSSLRAPLESCARPNRIPISVDIPQQNSTLNEKKLVIKFDIAALLHNVDLANSKPCMFNLDEQESCQQLMQNLKLEPVFSASWKR